MDYPEIRNISGPIYPRMSIVINRLGRYEEDYFEIIDICRKALSKKYEISFDVSNHKINIGKKIV